MNDLKPHGTRRRYQLGCRCALCSKAQSSYCKTNRLRLARDPDAFQVPTARVAEHVAELTRLGMSRQAISDAAGLPASTFAHFHERANVSRRTADAILAVRFEHASGRRLVGPSGTQRRIRALHAIGWAFARIAEATGLSARAVVLIANGKMDRVHASTHHAVRLAYDQMWTGVPAAATPQQRAGITWARRHAAGLGWAPPLAWDDDTIDDPAAVPCGAGYKAPSIAEQIRELNDMGLTREAIADRLGTKVNTVERTLERSRGAAA